ncbi:MAG: hypothetical protein WAL63_03635 [Solirubrobacteraceae bacterium]
MRFLRTASSGRLLAVIAGLVIAIAAGTAIAVAATTGGPKPKPQPLASALHAAATAPAVTGITARIRFTNNLIDSSDFTGDSANPILQGAKGRLWLGDNRMRLELQSDNGDAQVLVNGRSFWVSDPTSNTVYEGTLPADMTGSSKDGAAHAAPTIASIQSELTRLMARVTVGGASTSNPTNIAGRPAYSVSISPKHSGGLLGSLRLAWDAANGTPLNVAVYARGNPTPVLALTATDISYGAVPASDFTITPPAGDKVVTISPPAGGNAAASAHAKHAKHADVSGVAAVASKVPFTLAAPASLVGLPRESTTLLNWGGKPAAMVSYGRNLGGLIIIEQSAPAGASAKASGSSADGLALPSVSINGATGTELDTAIGSVVHFTSHGVAYTVIGSVPPYAANQAARGLTKSAS